MAILNQYWGANSQGVGKTFSLLFLTHKLQFLHCFHDAKILILSYQGTIESHYKIV